MNLSGGSGASAFRREGRSTGWGQTHSSAGHSGLEASRGRARDSFEEPNRFPMLVEAFGAAVKWIRSDPISILKGSRALEVFQGDYREERLLEPLPLILFRVIVLIGASKVPILQRASCKGIESS